MSGDLKKEAALRVLYATCNCGYLLPTLTDPHAPECEWLQAKKNVLQPYGDKPDN